MNTLYVCVCAIYDGLGVRGPIAGWTAFGPRAVSAGAKSAIGRVS